MVAGGYEDWIRKRYEEHRPRAAAKAGAQDTSRPGSPSSQANKKLSDKDQRDYDRLPGEIERLEAEVAAD